MMPVAAQTNAVALPKPLRLSDFGRAYSTILRRDGIVAVAMTKAERLQSQSEEFKAIVEKWPAERISSMVQRCSLPKRRVAALLSVGVSALTALCEGRYTPSPALCRRMEHVEEMAVRGELHGEYVSDKTSVQRRLTLFRAWFMEKPPEVAFPLVTVAIKIKWGRSPKCEFTLPCECLPSLRLTKWGGIVQVVKVVTSAVRELARANSRLLWRDVDEQFWRKYATDTLPEIVEQKASKKENHGV